MAVSRTRDWMYLGLLGLILLCVIPEGLARSEKAPLHEKPSESRKKDNSYIVVLKDGVDVDAFIDGFPGLKGLIRNRLTRVMNGFTGEHIPKGILDKLLESDDVDYVEENAEVVPTSVVSWGLDRIDQRNLPLDDQFFAQECYTETNGVDYRGVISTTVSNKICDKWGTSWISSYADAGVGDHNYCRNPDKDRQPWCFTTDPDVEWQYCDVGQTQASCIGECYTASNGADYRGSVDTTRNGDRCRSWADDSLGSFTPENFAGAGLGDHGACRNPDSDSSPWCLTEDLEIYWAYCDIGDPQADCDENPGYGHGVHLYVLDTGLRGTHNEFSGRVGNGYDATGGNNHDDCHGHGTRCGATAAGETYGAASKATVHGVKVLRCEGWGYLDDVIEGLDWVLQEYEAGNKPAVVSMSLGGKYTSPGEEQAIKALHDAGVVVVVAAGNSNIDACEISPAKIPEAITVGATSNEDKRAWFSNYGTCVDIFAPGVGIPTISHTGDDAVATSLSSGTSLACPYVAGAAAILLGRNVNLTPQEVRDKLLEDSTKDLVWDIDGTSSPNRLLYIV